MNTPRSKTNVDIVEGALDGYLTSMADRGIDPTGFKVSTLASLAGEPVGDMSHRLQQYRLAQARQTPTPTPGKRGRRQQVTRYVIAARSYGADARWRILAKPGTDPAVIRRARREQAKWIARDAFNRLVSDLITELDPSLRDNQHDQHIRRVLNFARGQFESVVEYVDDEFGSGHGNSNGGVSVPA